jgi:uncharacterized membrane protein YfcA
MGADFLLLLPAAFLAGLVDAVVGGGGLIQIPALFSALPHTGAATLFGTNKLSSICGTFSATLRYVRQVAVPWRIALLAALTDAPHGSAMPDHAPAICRD